MMNRSIGTIFSFLTVLIIVSCQTENEKPLPILGNKLFEDGDTIYHTVRDFKFIDQDSQSISNETFNDKIYVVDFFFISCPTICPRVKKQMLRLQERFGDEDQLMMLSHSIDTRNDTVPRLKTYAENLDINTDQWKLVTGNKDSIMVIAEDYFSIAKEDPNAPGGFDHSGRLILVDTERRVRSFCDGTDPRDVDRFMDDIDRLLAEINPAE
ncbi:MAG: SCO family protein [Saprospiraceae bacterium]|nr:SCO family protein [Saprospiraceae bacterium]